MERNPDRAESQFTSDRETIRGWIGDREIVPVRYAGTEGESGRLRIVPESAIEESHERVDWDEFYDELERSNQTVVYHGEDVDVTEQFEVMALDAVVEQTTLNDEEVEEALMAGETVTTTVTETTVIEQTIVEEATIESEVVSRETVGDEIVDAELLTREVIGCELVDAEVTTMDTESLDFERFQAGHRTVEEFEMAMDVEETWTLTREELERLTIESRIVETDVEETDTVESDTLSSRVDVEGVQRTLLQSDLLGSHADATEVIERGDIESEFREGNVVETRLFERNTVEEEVSLARRFTGEVTEAETTAAESVHREVIESDIVGHEDVDEAVLATETEAGTAAAAESDVETTATETTTTTETDIDEAEARTIPQEDDTGKGVIDASGNEIGMVTKVEGDTIYVDPHPSLTDRIKAALDWGDVDEDAYPVTANRIVAIDDDNVQIRIEE